MNRMRTVQTFSRNDARRNSFPRLNANKPLRSLSEVATITGLTVNEVQYLERLAFRKMRAALVAYGYKDPQ